MVGIYTEKDSKKRSAKERFNVGLSWNPIIDAAMRKIDKFERAGGFAQYRLTNSLLIWYTEKSKSMLELARKETSLNSWAGLPVFMLSLDISRERDLYQLIINVHCLLIRQIFPEHMGYN